MTSGTTWGDKEFEVFIGRLLRFGVILAAAWVLAGGIHYAIQYRGAKPDYRAFHGEPADLRYTHEIVQEALQLNARAVIQFGLLLLIATPIARITFSIFGYLMEKDYLYMLITCIVLAVILWNI